MKIENTVKLFMLTIVSIVLIACGETQRDVQWYTDNPDEIEAVLFKCVSTGDLTQNCQNADRANTIQLIGELPTFNRRE